MRSQELFVVLVAGLLGIVPARAQQSKPTDEDVDRAIYVCSLGTKTDAQVEGGLNVLKRRILTGEGKLSYSEIPSVLGTGVQTDDAKIKIFEQIQQCVVGHVYGPSPRSDDRRKDLNSVMQSVFGEAALNMRLGDFPTARPLHWPDGINYLQEQQLAPKVAGNYLLYRLLYWDPKGNIAVVRYHLETIAPSPPSPYRDGRPPPVPPQPRCENTFLRQNYFSLAATLGFTPLAKTNQGGSYVYNGLFENVTINFSHDEGIGHCTEYLDFHKT